MSKSKELDEELAKKIVEAMNDQWMLDNVIVPALRGGTKRQAVLCAKILGLSAVELEEDRRLVRKGRENDSAKTTIDRWKKDGMVIYTEQDLPGGLKGSYATLGELYKLAKSNLDCFASYCGTLYFNKFGYHKLVERLVKRGYLSEESASSVLRSEGLL